MVLNNLVVGYVLFGTEAWPRAPQQGVCSLEDRMSLCRAKKENVFNLVVESYHHSLIVLIPKLEEASRVEDFRPVATFYIKFCIKSLRID